MALVPSRQILGTAQVVIDTAVAIAASNFSGAPALTFDNTTDAVVPYATHAKAMAEFPDWAAAPVQNTTIQLWGVLIDTDGTDDDTDVPSGTSANGARYFGQFIVNDLDALQRRTITISLMGCEKVDFYLLNGTAQSMTNTPVNCVLKVTPFSVGVNV